MDLKSWSLLVSRSDVACGDVRAEDLRPLDEGQALLRIERLALSANNLTYAAMGDQLGFWSLFPARPGWGCIPAWGHARVVASRADGVDVDTLLFGLLPMSSHVVLTLRPSRIGMREISPHRARVNPVYNQYALELQADEAALDNKATFHPLFITSFVLALHVLENAAFGASEVIVLSASSKTALGLGHLLRGKLPVTGLTSSRHLGWVERLGLYHHVASYEEAGQLGQLGDGVACLVIDFSGDSAILDRMSNTLGSRCVQVIKVGGTHGGAIEAEAMFSGPRHIEQRVRQWGAEAFDQRLREALQRFNLACRDEFQHQHADGMEAMVAAYTRLVRGEQPASTLLIARPNGKAEASLS